MPNLESEEDYGLSDLAGRFHQDWTLEGTAHQIAEIYTEEEGAAALVLDDVLRVLEPPLPDSTLAALWQAATGGLQDLDLERRGVDVRQWLQEVADVCVARIRRDDPAFTATTPAPAADKLAAEVLDEIARAEPVLDGLVSYVTSRPVPGVAAALRLLVAHAGTSLGFRFLLRIMYEHWVPISEARYRRYRALSEHLGPGRYHLDQVGILTKLRS